MPRINSNLLYDYKRPPPSYLAPQDVPDYQGKYNDPATKRNLDLLAVNRSPLAAPAPTPTVPTAVSPKGQNWWSKLGAGGQSALMRSALAAGSSMLERTDPQARNPFTVASAGLLKGIDVHDTIREQQRKEGVRSRLADISTEQPSAAYAGEVGRTLASTGDVPGALSAFQTESRLTPDPIAPTPLRTVRPGEGVYDPTTGETTTPIPPTERKAEEFTLGTGSIRYKRDSDGNIVEVARGRESAPGVAKPIDEQVRESKLRNTIEGIVSKRFGRPPEEYTGFGVRDKDFAIKKRQYDNETESLRQELMIKAGLATQADFEPGPEDIYGPSAPSPTTLEVRPGSPELNESYVRDMQEDNPGVSEEMIAADYYERYSVR